VKKLAGEEQQAPMCAIADNRAVFVQNLELWLQRGK
jgi:hypothetical protein